MRARRGRSTGSGDERGIPDRSERRRELDGEVAEGDVDFSSRDSSSESLQTAVGAVADGEDNLRDRIKSDDVREVRVVEESRKEVERGAENDGVRRITEP